MTGTPQVPSTRFLLRPCAVEDLPAMERFAEASAHGLTTLPSNRAALAARIERSLQAFATDDASGEEIYLFVVEDCASGEVVGTSGVAAQAGFSDRFYSYRNEFVVHRSQALGASNRIHTLHLCHDLTGFTLLTSFYIDPRYEDSLAAQLLSRARLLFIAAHADRFSDRIAAESPGLADASGRCPFWDAVGRRFFGMNYPAVERLAGGRSKAFIAELMPPSPVYVPLLPEEAQWAIGQLHPVAELPFSILLDEGFDAETYVDIFDGGPTVQERVGMLKTVSRARPLRAEISSASQSHADSTNGAFMVATPALSGFRASIVVADASDSTIKLDAETAQSMGIARGDLVRVAEFDGIGGE
jgi:arginine N-succinyltransferase